MNATIYDVSRLSGVSTATVSRAFSNPEQVREATRRKVFEAAEVLHYYPNAIARAMARQRTDKIAYLICKKDATILDEFYASICESIMRKVNRSPRRTTGIRPPVPLRPSRLRVSFWVATLKRNWFPSSKVKMWLWFWSTTVWPDSISPVWSPTREAASVRLWSI